MTIVARGPRNLLTLENSGVLVKEIWDAVAEHKNVEWLTNRYPITEYEVFECIDALIDLTEPHENDFIQLKCTKGGVTIAETDIETVGITDRIFFSLVSYGRTFNNDVTDIQQLFVEGLITVVSECLADIKQGANDYLNSDLHVKVYNAFIEAYSKVGSVEEILEVLDTNTIFKRSVND